jgi:AraC-like DNA-binding protein
MRPSAHGRILFWEGASLWLVRAPPGKQYPRTDVHAHHAVQITLALTGRIDFDGDGGRFEGEVIAIAPDSRHAFQGTGLVAHLFVAPEGTAGRRITRQLFVNGPIASISASRLGDLPEQLRTAFEDPRHTDEALRTSGRALLARFAGTGGDVPPTDPRIAKLLTAIGTRHDEQLSLRDVAELVDLSPGRTRHLFVEQTGLPLRTYVLWMRLLRALEMFVGGASLTEAAHGAGFSDSAHLSRTFHRMFGIVAASLRVS